MLEEPSIPRYADPIVTGQRDQNVPIAAVQPINERKEGWGQFSSHDSLERIVNQILFECSRETDALPPNFSTYYEIGAATDVSFSPGRGHDIAHQRSDDLDAMAIDFANTSPARSVFVDLGCGIPIQALRFAVLGHFAIAVDFADRLEQIVSYVRDNYKSLLIRAVVKKFEHLNSSDFPNPIHCLYSQRSIHYLHPAEALRLMRMFRRNMSGSAKVFLSASGLSSELGEGYEATNMPWERRFGFLSDAMKLKHNISNPICLYEQKDLEKLMFQSGFRADIIYTSSFGNIKGVFLPLD